MVLRGQVRRLLGILLAEHDRSVGTDVLIDRLWPEDTAPSTARKIVHILTGRLRRELEGESAAGGEGQRLTTTENGYLLHGGASDLARYEELLGHAESMAGTEPRAALAALEEALELWGRPWGAQGNESWLAPRVATIEERHRRAEELWADLVLETGAAGSSVERMRAAVLGEPYRERRWAQLMLALYRDGRQVEALRVYDEANALLLHELGLSPGPELQRLRVAILEHDIALQLRRLPATDVFGATSFVGRARELAQIGADLTKHRLLTVVGIGGIGKTRVVDEYAETRRFAGDDVRRASFASAAGGGGAAVHLATELGLGTDAQSDHDAADLIAAALGREPVLLVLDRLERVTGANGIVLRLIERCPRLRVLATSRVPLGVQAERILNLQPLPIGRPGESDAGTALELLIDRAGLERAALDDDALAELVARAEATGGIPMLVELAAPSVLPADRSQPAVAADWDHRSATREAIEQALAAVDERACELAIDAAVLPDGVGERTAAALRGVPDDVARRAVRQLVWVNLMGTRAGLDGIRYQSLDPVRDALIPASAPDRQDAVERASRAVEEVFRAFAPSTTVPHVLSRLDAAEDEHSNLRFLLADQLKVKPLRALELTITASEFWAARGFSVEGRRWIQDAIAAAQPERPLSWDATLALARTTRTFAEISALRDVLENLVREMRTAGTDWVRMAGGLMYLAISRGWSGDPVGAIEALNEVEPLIERSGTEWTRVIFERLRGLELVAKGDLLGARVAQRAALPRLIELGDPSTAAQTVYLSAVLGDMAGCDDVLDDIRVASELATTVRDVSLLGQLLLLEARALKRAGDERSRELFAEAAERLRNLGGIRAASLAYRDLGLLELADNDDAAATDHLRRSLLPLLQLDRPAAALAVGALGVIRHRCGDERRAVTLLALAGALHSTVAPTWKDDSRQLAALADSIGLPLAEQPAEYSSDDALLELLDLG